MEQLQAYFGDNLGLVLALIAVALALTIFVFRRRFFDRGYRKGSAANPSQVKRDNPADDWSRSH